MGTQLRGPLAGSLRFPLRRSRAACLDYCCGPQHQKRWIRLVSRTIGWHAGSRRRRRAGAGRHARSWHRRRAGAPRGGRAGDPWWGCRSAWRICDLAAYDIYVGANVSGNCGPLTNSGGFASLTFDSVIRGIRFRSPSEEGLPGPFGGSLRVTGCRFPCLDRLLAKANSARSACVRCTKNRTSIRARSPKALALRASLSLGPSEMGIRSPPGGNPRSHGGGEALLLYSIGSTSDLARS